MKIAVCMKQVPAYSEGNMDEKTGLLIRSGLTPMVNVYDMAALELALQMKEKGNGQVDVFTMGPERAKEVIREAYALGADRGFLISDSAFAGADVLATSYTLMQAILCQGIYDYILCGVQTTDGDTGLVSGALAKWMEIPHFYRIGRLLAIDDKEIQVEQVLELQHNLLKIESPCLMTADRDCFTPRMPSLKLRMAGKKKEVGIIKLEDLRDTNCNHYGLAGSATKVKKIFPPDRTEKQNVFQMEGEKAAAYIYKVLQNR